MEEENNLRPDHHHYDHDHDHESHVAQQSRRDRLRIHELPNNLEMNSDQQFSRNVRCSDSFYEPVVLSSSSSSMARPMSNSSLAGVSNHLVGDWRSCDWMVSGWLGGTDQNHPLSTMHCHDNSPNYNMHESPNRASTDHDHNMNFASPGFQSSLQDVVTIASSGVSRPAGDIGNQLFQDNSSGWRPHRPAHDYPNQEFGNVASDWRTQGLSLTLSSNPPFQLGEGFVSGDIDQQLPKDRQDFNNSGSACSVMPNPIISRGGSSGKSVKDVIPSAATLTHPSTGPLGPFTGYATILKSSKFLKPAQQLLDEFCSVPGSEVYRTSEVPERISGKVSMLAEAFDASDNQALMVRNSSGGGGGGSAASSSTLYSSNNRGAGECAVKDRPRESCQPEYQQKKAKLAYMHEEVCRRYNQYHQQMQMVVSSFETVAGLSDATPYISLALKTVSRHFRSLRNVISDQLWHIRKALGEDLMFPATGSNKGDELRQKYKEQNFQKHKSGGDNVGFHDPQQQVWRPQRGLPERSVAILRTWLFEHFLHPYPTDTDKHMLAAQTGLSRNQVSNWFINARVRVWKPMVEEIHMLETSSLAQANKSEENLVGEGTSREETANRAGMNALASNHKHVEFPGNIGSSTNINCEQWSQEKRSRVECQIPQSIERSSYMGFMPYQRGGLEMGGLGAVSLTLGLRHTAENAQQQQQQFKQQEDQLQRQFGGHMFHDFVG